MPQIAGKQTPSSRFYLIQMLRGLAAVVVVLHHQDQAAGLSFPLWGFRRWMENGAFGVDLFFPISGFVMYLSALRPGVRWSEFAWRRYVRVAPIYYLCTLAKLAIFFVAPATMLYYRFEPANALAAFFFVPNFNFRHAIEPPLVVGWTLEFEMFFYAIVTLVLAMRWPLLRVCGAILIALGMVGFFVHGQSAIASYASPIVLEFLAGMLIAAGVPYLKRIPAPVAALTFFSALLFALVYPVGAVSVAMHCSLIPAWAIPGALMLAMTVALEPRLRLQPGSRTLSRLRPLLLLGDASYMLYLLHTFVVPAVQFLIRPLHLSGLVGFFVWVSGGMALSIALAIACHVYCELPLLRALEQRRPPWSARSAEIPA